MAASWPAGATALGTVGPAPPNGRPRDPSQPGTGSDTMVTSGVTETLLVRLLAM
jgi:hypothetical protein